MAQERVAIVLNGVVTNTIVADPTTYKDSTGGTVVATSTANIGDSYVNGVFTPAPAAPLTPAEVAAEITAAANLVLRNGQTFNVAAAGSPAVNVLSDGMSTTIGVLAAFYIFGSMPNQTGTKSWTDNNGVVTVLSAAECVSFSNQVGTWADNVYAAAGTFRAQAIGQPNATPPVAPTITTEAQVAALQWPTS